MRQALSYTTNISSGMIVKQITSYEVQKCFFRITFWRAHEEFTVNALSECCENTAAVRRLSESSWMIWAQTLAWLAASILLKCPRARHPIFTADPKDLPVSYITRENAQAHYELRFSANVPLAGFCPHPAKCLLMHWHLTSLTSVYFHKAWVKGQSMRP